MEFFVFLLFAGVLTAMYLGIRRQWASPGIIAGGGALGSIVTMVMFMLARDTSIAQGIILGTIIGAMFAVATLSVAWYFHSNELRAMHGHPVGETHAGSVTEEYYE